MSAVRFSSFSMCSLAALVATAVLLAACVSDPVNSAHEKPLAASDIGLSGPAIAPRTDDAWWHAFADPQLDQLIATAVARNPGLAGSLSRVRIASEQAVAAHASELPQVAFDGSVTRERFSENYIFPPPYGGGTYWEGRLGFNVDWRLDFWGRQAALVEQAGRSAEAVALDAASAELLLSSSVAHAYLEYARARRLEAVALQAQAQRRALLDLTTQRVGAGLDTNAELRAAESNLELSAVDIEQARLAATLARNALTTLTGGSAAAAPELAMPAIEFDSALPLPATLPADLLAHRPDVRAGQARIAAAIAGRAAAQANFYPNVDLVGFVGVVGLGLDELLQGNSNQWSVGPAVHLPIFDAGRLKAEYRRTGAELDAAIASYNDTVLRSVREAADQSARLRSFELQLDAQQRALVAAEQSYDLATQRYSAGLASQVAVLNAETQVLAARRQRTQMLADRTSARIALLVALGGHFSQEPAR